MVSVGAAALILVAGATQSPIRTSTPNPNPTSSTTDTAPPPELSLEDALAALEAQNLSLAQARSRAEEAGGVADQARAALLPSLLAVASYTRNSDEARLPMGSPLVPVSRAGLIQPLESFSATGFLRVPLVVPAAWLELRAARDSARAAAASADAVRLELRAGLMQAAHGARATEEVVVATERAVANAGALARSAERRVAAGTAAPLEALTARTEQVRRESDLAQARAELARAQLALGILLGREGPVRIAVDDPRPPPGGEGLPPRADGDGSLSLAEALGRRPELRARRAQIEASDAALRSTWARLAPQLSATASAFAADVAYPTGEQEGWRATLDLSWTFLDGGMREGRRRQARAQLAAARAAADAERLAVVQEIADGERDVAVAAERLRLAETRRQLASEAAESARRSFEAGIVSSLDVIDANDRLFQADVGLAEARARLAQARIALERALGHG